jgi:hypothetical protein
MSMVARARKDGQSEEKSEIALEKHPVDEIFDYAARLRHRKKFQVLKKSGRDCEKNRRRNRCNNTTQSSSRQTGGIRRRARCRSGVVFHADSESAIKKCTIFRISSGKFRNVLFARAPKSPIRRRPTHKRGEILRSRGRH